MFRTSSALIFALNFSGLFEKQKKNYFCYLLLMLLSVAPLRADQENDNSAASKLVWEYFLPVLEGNKPPQ